VNRQGATEGSDSNVTNTTQRMERIAVDQLAPTHKAQVISCLKAMQLRLALLINFNVAVLRDGVQRVVLSAP
jgi:GxxExxY protein